MTPLNLAIVKRSKLIQLKSENERMNIHTRATNSILENVQNKEWSKAIEKIRALQESSITKSLTSLIKSLEEVSAQEEKTDWKNTGLIKISEVISQNQSNLVSLADALIRTLANYCKANQGVFFTIDEQDSKDACFNLAGSYAHLGKHLIGQKIDLEEGQLGRCYHEGEPIYLTNIPASYIKIKSGLGEASARSVVLIPIKNGSKKVGVFELAFFRILQPHEYDFLNSTSEMIANAILNIETNAKTLELLKRSEAMSFELKLNEEKLNQNLEEMLSIQEALTVKNEELIRSQKEVELVKERENELIESKLNTQQLINDKVINQLKLKIEKLQKEIIDLKKQGAIDLLIDIKPN